MKPNSYRDYVTLVKLTDSRGKPLPANKRIARHSDGFIDKKAGLPLEFARARTVRVPNVFVMKRLLKKVKSNSSYFLSLGYVPGTEPDPHSNAGPWYWLMSKKLIAKATGKAIQNVAEGWQRAEGQKVIAKTKANFVFGTWLMFDFDSAPGMPDELKGLSRKAAWNHMSSLMPGLPDAGVVFTHSASGQVLVDGEPLSKDGGFHAFVQVADPDDIGRFSKNLLMHSMLKGTGFLRPYFDKETGEELHSRPWSIFDPSVFSPERPVYEGKPKLRGTGLRLRKPRILTRKGGRLITAQLPNLTDAETETIRRKTGYRVVYDRAHGDRAQWILQSDNILRLDTVLDSKDGSKSVAELLAEGLEKVRCQAPFRESGSYAAFFAVHEDGTPFVYDIGVLTKYVLSENERQKILSLQVLNWVNDANTKPDDILDGWLDKVRPLSAIHTVEVIRLVHSRTNAGLNPLKAVLKEARKQWETEDKQTQNLRHRELETESGRVPMDWDESQLHVLLDEVQKIAVEDSRSPNLLCHADTLVGIGYAKPKTAGEMQELGQFGKFAKGLVIKQHSKESLRPRLMHSIAFYQGEKPIAAPEMLVKTMVHAHDHKVPTLIGLAENPFADPQGNLVTGDGYNKETGLYFSISVDLGSLDPDRLSIADARRALRYIERVVFAEFPFDSKLDRAGAVAMMLTALERPMITGAGGCPGFLVNAPGQSVGKTTLVQLISTCVYGRAVAAATWSNDDKELAKQILAALMEGRLIVLFDNLPEGLLLTSNELAKAMTSLIYQGRRLGDNALVDALTNVIWSLTGNNVTPTGDFVTRVLPIRLDAKEERPDQRDFKREQIAEWCMKNRRKILRALLTIVLVGLKPENQQRIRDMQHKRTRFPSWDKMVRYPMLLAGSVDPAELFEKNRVEDPRNEARAHFMKSWFDHYGDKWVSLSQVVDDVKRVNRYEPASTLQPFALKDALDNLMPQGNINSSGLGGVLRHFKDRKIEGYTIQQKPKITKSKGSRPWCVKSDHPCEKEAEEFLDLSIDLDDE